MAPRVLIVPQPTPEHPDTSTIITLPHPRTSIPTRYLVHPTKGLHEITKIPSTTAAPRSWLLTANGAPDQWPAAGHVVSAGDLYISTPIDPLFLLLPLLLPAEHSKITPRFRPLDDVVEALANGGHWSAVTRPGSAVRKQLEARIRAVSDSVDVGDEKAYRVSIEKAMGVLATKCEAMTRGGLPKSLEEEFVVRPLVSPVTAESLGRDNGDGKPTTTTTTTTAVEVRGGADEEAPSKDAPSQITHLLRIRVASQFLSSVYLPPHLASQFLTHLASTHDNFSTLDAHLESLKKLRNDAAAARSGDFSLKRSANDDEAADTRAEKKRKLEEEEKRKKKNVSHGVKVLSKVNTRGMAKMTSFFKKKEA